MRGFITLVCVTLVVGTMVSLATRAANVNGGWPEYKADALDYAENHLPPAVVIYVYGPNDDLVSVINTDGKNDKNAIRKVGNIIDEKKFPKLADRQRGKVAASIRNFLLDQGYSIDELVDNKAKFTLILTLYAVSKTDCPRFLEVFDDYERVVRRAIKAHPSNVPEYSVVVLRLGSPQLKLKCKK
ncbi:MAG TPA: hypothetical protein VFJ26_16105 [Dyella sp.]|nr:hypothetical protein [Dyella sp.]